MPLPRRIENIPQEDNKDSSRQTEKNNVRSGETLARKSNSIPTKRPVRDDTFMEDEPLPPIAEVSPHGVKNLDEKELDELLGINDVINVDEEENNDSLSTSVDDALPDFDNNEISLPSSEEISINSDNNIEDTKNDDSEDDFDDDFEIDSLLKSLDIDENDENDESSEDETLPEIELESSETDSDSDSFIPDNYFEGLFDEIDNDDDNTQNTDNVSLDEDDDEIIIDFEDDSEDDATINKNNDDSEEDFYFENEKDNDTSDDEEDDFEIDSLLKSLDIDDNEINSDNENEEDEDWGFSENEDGSDDDSNDAFTPVEVDDKEKDDESEIVNDYFDDEEETEEIDEENKPFNFYDDDEDDKTSQDKESKPKPSKKKKSGKGFKNKFENIKNQVLADIKGEDAPTQNSFDEQDDDDEEYDDETTESNKPKSPLPGSKVLDLIKKPYLFVANIFFSILKGIFGFLAQIPLIGIVFKPLLSATKILEKISLFMPLIFVIGVFVTISYFQVPRESMIELPDSGGGTFSEFKYDYKTNSAIGKVTNTGEIILESKPEFTVHAIVPGLNPKTWFIPVEVGKCEGKVEKVDIDSSKEVTAECEKTNGYIKRTSGVLK